MRAALLAIPLLSACLSGEPRLLSERADRRFRIEVQSRRPVWDLVLPRGPGQGSDVPGLVRLCDASGRVLATAQVELLSGIAPSDVRWSSGRVEVALVADWPLPR